MERKYFAIMVLCFLYGGYSLFIFASQLYFPVWRSEFLGLQSPSRGPLGRDWPGRQGIDENLLDQNEFEAMQARLSSNPLASATSPYSLTLLGGGIISILAGTAVWNLTRKKEIKKIKQEITSNLLLPNEKSVVDALAKSDFELTQSALARETGLNKVQVYRAIKSLETKNIVSKHAYGLTNKIILNKEFRELEE